MTETLTDRVCAHLAQASFEAIPAETVARAKVRLLDAVGTIAAGVRAAGNDGLISLVRGWGGTPESTILTTGVMVPAQNAALVNAVLMRSFDFEPVGADWSDGSQIPSHITGTTAAVALAVAEARGSTGRELLTALVYGDDLAARLGHATGFDVYGGGDNTGTINVLGAVATAGLLMGLDERQLRDALGIGVNQLGGTIENIFDKTLAFKLPIGLSARNAVFSAELAATGFSGPVDAIGGRFGYLSAYGSTPDRTRVTEGLGEAFYADAVIKPWPTCRASHASLDATVRLANDFEIDPDDVERVEVHVTPATKGGFVGQPFRVGPSPEVSGAFSIQFTTATALLHRTVALAHMSETHMRDPRLQGMLDRVELVATLAPTEVRTAEVEVWLRSGGHYRVRTEHPLGDLHFNPLGDGQIQAKFRSNVEFGGGLAAERADAIAGFIAGIEGESGISELSRLLAH